MGWAQFLVGTTSDSARIERHASNILLARALVAAGGASKQEDLLQQAVFIANKSLEYAIQEKDTFAEGQSNYCIAECQFAAKDINAAADALIRSRELFVQSGDVASIQKADTKMTQFRNSNQWTRRKVLNAEGKLEIQDEVEKAFTVLSTTGWHPGSVKNSTLYIHLDNMTARSAKNIG